MSSAVDLIAGAALARRAAIFRVSAPALVELVRTFTSGDGYLAVIDDNDAVGPECFDAGPLAHLLKDSAVIVCSGDVTEPAAAYIASLIRALPVPRVAIIETQIAHHESWSNKVHALSGAWPVLHVAGDGLDASKVGGPAVDASELSGRTLH